MKVAFQVIPNIEKVPNRYQFVNCHMAFNITLEDIYRNACLVAGDSMAQTADFITDSSVVTRETVNITLTMAILDKI